MSDRWVVTLAGATLAGAWFAHDAPVLLAFGLVVLAVVTAKPPVVCLAAAATATVLGARAWDGVTSHPTSGTVTTNATIVRDPEWKYGSLRSELRLADGRRVTATFTPDAAPVAVHRLAGEGLAVEGRLRPVATRSRTFLARRHIGSALTVSSATHTDPGGPVTRFTNQLRRTLVRGTASMPTDRRSLFTGLVLGDDRDQSPTEVDDFRAAGLSHLLAVSGQNVAFVIAVASPLLRRLGLRARFTVGAGILLVFGMLTRWEPSVLRAVAMAALALGAATAGRPASSIRVLGLATTALVLIDPMLAGSVGFLLSVGACTGIACLAPRLHARRVPAPIAVTLAAQVGVAPVLVPVFGGIPMASLPANLLAVPAAGPVMVWGLVAGLPAGIVGGPVAEAIHLPTRVLLAWIAGVAKVAAATPMPQIGPVGVAAMVAAGGLAVVVSARPRIAVAVAGAALAAPVLAASVRTAPHRDGAEIASGVRLWQHEGATVLVVGGHADESALLGALRTAEIRTIDVLVLRSGGSASARLAAAVRHRATVRVAVAPPGHAVPDASALDSGESVIAGPLAITVEASVPRLDVRVGSARAPRARSPPVRRDHASPGHGHPQPHD